MGSRLSSPGPQQRRFAAYIEGLANAAGHADRHIPLKNYCTGLLLPGERKSVEPMAARLAPDNVRRMHQSLHHVVADAPWNHDKLMARIAKRVGDQRMLKLIRAFLKAGVMENGLGGPVDEGTPQGGPLSPLLSNIVLDEFDRELERRGLRFARYADDSNIYVRSRRAGERVMASITRFITTKLKLKVNEQKSAVARPWERKFLGFSFTVNPEPKRRIAPKAVGRFKAKIREMTRRTRGVSVEKMAEVGPISSPVDRLFRPLPGAFDVARS